MGTTLREVIYQIGGGIPRGRLFKAANPMEAGDDFLKHLNPNSLEILKECRMEPGWGMQLRDEQMVLDLLVTRKEIDPQKIGVEGMSMGSTIRIPAADKSPHSTAR
jgi:dienelactone hydrolase